MRKFVLFGFLGLAALSASAQAQVTFDMSRVTCADYAAMDPVTSRDFSAWMSGWFNQRAGSTRLNVEGYRRNVASVQSWCASNPRQLVMAGLTTAAANARPGQPGPTDIDGSMITCGQFLAADADTQLLISSWMGGWFMSTKNLTNVDNRYVARNTRVVGEQCQRNRNQKLMTVIEENFR
ncbi:MAG: HdeA/HdeB family chaperone [Beijerinckiaceae bacterium]